MGGLPPVRQVSERSCGLARQEPLADCLEQIYWVGLQVLSTEMMRMGIDGTPMGPIECYPNGVQSLPPFSPETVEQAYDFDVTPNPLQYQQLPKEQDEADASDVDLGGGEVHAWQTSEVLRRSVEQRA